MTGTDDIMHDTTFALAMANAGKANVLLNLPCRAATGKVKASMKGLPTNLCVAWSQRIRWGGTPTAYLRKERLL